MVSRIKERDPPSSASDDSDAEAPTAVSLKAAKDNTQSLIQAQLKAQEKSQFKRKNAIKEIRARRHERNLLQKKVKVSLINNYTINIMCRYIRLRQKYFLEGCYGSYCF